jgi:hypothetical protein
MSGTHIKASDHITSQDRKREGERERCIPQSLSRAHPNDLRISNKAPSPQVTIT